MLWHWTKKAKPECEVCIDYYQAEGLTKIKCPGIQFVDECPGSPNGKVPKLSPDNYKFTRWFFEKIFPYMQNGMGGFSSGAIERAFNTFEISKEIRPYLYDSCTIMVTTFRQVYAKEHSKQ